MIGCCQCLALTQVLYTLRPFLVSVSIQYFSAVVIMLLDIKLEYIVRFSFYGIIIGVTINSLIKLWEEPTAFDEKIVKGDAILPSFTLCPNQPDDPHNDKSIESFEDVTKSLEKFPMEIEPSFTSCFHPRRPSRVYLKVLRNRAVKNANQNSQKKGI